MPIGKKTNFKPVIVKMCTASVTGKKYGWMKWRCNEEKMNTYAHCNLSIYIYKYVFALVPSMKKFIS